MSVHARQYQDWHNVFELSLEDRLMEYLGCEKIVQ
jgi:Ran GTPase-activating protein (RanGAP) involved in mRNA processing and transport